MSGHSSRPTLATLMEGAGDPSLLGLFGDVALAPSVPQRELRSDKLLQIQALCCMGIMASEKTQHLTLHPLGLCPLAV